MAEKKKKVEQAATAAPQPVEVIPAETPAVSVVETVPTKGVEVGKVAEVPAAEGGSSNEKLTVLIKKINPGADISTDEALLGAAYESLNKLDGFQDKIKQVVEEYPEFGDAIEAILKGMSPQEAITRYFDTEGLNPPEGAPDYEAISKAKGERRKGIEAKDKRQKELADNEQISITNIKAFQAKMGWDDKKTLEYINKVESLQQDLYDGKLSPEHLNVLENGFAFEDVIKKKDAEKKVATEDAQIKGRNEQIAKKRTAPPKGDGMPKLGNTGSVSIGRSGVGMGFGMASPNDKLNFKPKKK